MREYRTFYIKLPTGVLHQEIFCVNKPVSELREKVCDVMGVGKLNLLYHSRAFLTCAYHHLHIHVQDMYRGYMYKSCTHGTCTSHVPTIHVQLSSINCVLSMNKKP